MPIKNAGRDKRERDYSQDYIFGKPRKATFFKGERSENFI